MPATLDLKPTVVCREASDLTAAHLRAAEALYTSTQHPDERIPWGWIARSVKAKATERPDQPGRHLILAVPHDSADDSAVLGFVFGSYLAGFGGYVCYLGVDPSARRSGVATQLFAAIFSAFDADAAESGERVPLVVWESKRPAADSDPAAHSLWQARLRSFARAGAYRVEGLTLLTPNYNEPGREPVPLQLFVKPRHEAVEAMTPARLCKLAADLLQRVYRLPPDDELAVATLAGAPSPLLVLD